MFEREHVDERSTDEEIKKELEWIHKMKGTFLYENAGLAKEEERLAKILEDRYNTKSNQFLAE
jgi:hypothetical protein